MNGRGNSGGYEGKQGNRVFTGVIERDSYIFMSSEGYYSITDFPVDFMGC